MTVLGVAPQVTLVSDKNNTVLRFVESVDFVFRYRNAAFAQFELSFRVRCPAMCSASRWCVLRSSRCRGPCVCVRVCVSVQLLFNVLTVIVALLYFCSSRRIGVLSESRKQGVRWMRVLLVRAAPR
jgi:hypothetical protein